MKRKLSALSRGYKVALQDHLQKPSDGLSEAAQRLGHRALALGLDTLGMARIHEQALVALGGSTAGNGRRAGAFFAEVIHPIEETHLKSREARVRLVRLNATLSRRTAQLATRSRHLKRGITNRKSAEKALRQREDRHSKLLKESAQLEQRLRRLAHRLLQAQESVRRKISAGIRDEIAQTLLGINVRLLSLKTGAQVSSKHRLKEITSTQQLVARSARILQRVASGIEKAA